MIVAATDVEDGGGNAAAAPLTRTDVPAPCGVGIDQDVDGAVVP